MRSPRIPRHQVAPARLYATALAILTIGVPLVPAPGTITARAAPTVSAAPAAVIMPPASVAPAPQPAGAAVVGAPLAGAATPAQWTWPVGPPRDLLRPFEAPASSYAAGHRGIDIGAGPGSPVRAPADGVVSFAGVVVDRPVLSIQHADDLVSSVEPVTAVVAAGERVSAGQVVGVVATGAHCTDRCLHFGVRRHGQYISPMLFLGGIARAVLLPLDSAG